MRRSYSRAWPDNFKHAGKSADCDFSGRYPKPLQSLLFCLWCFVSPSKHEGFCLPLVEAMAAKVPIRSYDSAAIPKPWAPPGSFCRIRDAQLLADSIHLLVKDEAMSVAIGNRRPAPLREILWTSSIETTFCEALGNLN